MGLPVLAEVSCQRARRLSAAVSSAHRVPGSVIKIEMGEWRNRRMAEGDDLRTSFFN